MSNMKKGWFSHAVKNALTLSTIFLLLTFLVFSNHLRNKKETIKSWGTGISYMFLYSYQRIKCLTLSSDDACRSAVLYHALQFGLRNKKKTNSKIFNCSKGSLNECIELTMQYRLNDEPLTKKLFHFACEKGISRACMKRGLIEWYNNNNTAAKNYFELSCLRYHSAACTKLGTMELEHKNDTRAEELFEWSCRRGHAEGCTQLGLLQSKRGLSVSAMEWYHLGCSNKSSNSCFNLAQLYLKKKDHKKAIEMLMLPCSDGQTESCYFLTQLRKQRPVKIAKKLVIDNSPQKNLGKRFQISRFKR